MIKPEVANFGGIIIGIIFWEASTVDSATVS